MSSALVFSLLAWYGFSLIRFSELSAFPKWLDKGVYSGNIDTLSTLDILTPIGNKHNCQYIEAVNISRADCIPIMSVFLSQKMSKLIYGYFFEIQIQ